MIATMDLEEWRKVNNLTLVQLANRLGCSTSQARRYCTGESKIADEMRERVDDVTGGVVTDFALRQRRLAWKRTSGSSGVRVELVASERAAG